MGQSVVLLGMELGECMKSWGTKWERHWELLRIWWEHIENMVGTSSSFPPFRFE
jgi:hypothetical protein